MKNITSKLMKVRLQFIVFAIFSFLTLNASAQFFLKTVPPLNGGNSSTGVTFNVTANQTLRIDSIFGTLGAGTFEVWYSTTAISGPPTITALNGWVQIGTGLTITTTTPTGSIKPLPKNFGLIIPAGQTYGFYVGGASTTYSNGTVGVSAPFTDGIMTIETGNLVGYGGAAPNPTFHPRQFNGGIKYTVLGGMNDAAVLAVDSPTVFCAGNQNVYATIANFGGNQINSVTVNWSFDGVLQTPVTYTGLLDTLNGLGNTAKVFLGNKNFPSGTPKAIKVWTSLPNGVADTSNFNDTINVFKSASIAGGVYTINSMAAASATNFTDFSSFFSLVNQYGICSSVTLNVVAGSGPYLEQVNIKNFNGSPSRSLTINGNGETIDFAATVTGERSTFVIENSSYITIDSLNVTTSGTGFGTALFMNSINHLTVRNSSFITDTTSTTTNFSAVRISGSQTSQTTATSFSNLTFEGNTLKGGYYGFTFYGSSAALSQNIIIRKNKISAFYYYGAYMYYSDGLLFEQNDISRPYRTTVSSCYASYFFGNINMIVNRNAIHNLYDAATTSTSTAYALYSGSDGLATNPNIIMNNLIYGFNHNGSVYGLYDAGSDYTNYYNNIVSIDNVAATAGASYGVYKSVASTATEFQNNIISITRGGSGLIYGYYFSQPAAVSNFNNVYINSAGTGAHNYGYNGSAKATLVDWQAAGYGANDLEIDPTFANLALNDLQPNNVSLNAAGFPAPQVVEDFNGVPRDILANDIGAFNISSPPLDIAANSLLAATPFCAGLNDVSVVLSNNGTIRIDSVKINWSINGVVQTPINYQSLLDTIGSVSGNIDTVLLTSYNFMSGVAADFVVWLSAPNGVTPDAFPGNDTASATYGAALVGNYTINQNAAASTTNYTTFTSFVNAVSQFGICGPTTANVVAGSGPYLEQVVLKDVKGTSINTLTINGRGESLVFAASNTNERETFLLENSSYIKIDSLNVLATGATYGTTLRGNNLDHITISNCNFIMDSTSTSSFYTGLLFSSSPTSPASATDIDSLVFENNTVMGGYYGLSFYGNSITKSIKNVIVRNNKIRGFYYSGTYVYYADGFTYEDNDVSRPYRSNMTTTYGILSSTCENLLVQRNAFHNLFDANPSSTSACYPIYSTNDAPIGKENYFINNLVYEINTTGTIYGIYDLGSDYTKFYNNTVVLNNPSTSASGVVRGVYKSATSLSTDYINNVIYIATAGTSTVHGLYYNGAPNISDYNDVYLASAGTQYYGYLNAANRSTLLDMQTAGLDTNSLDVNPIFSFPITSSALLQPLSSALNNSGLLLPQVTVDFNGTARNASGMDIGSFEFTPPSVDAGVNSIDIATSFCPGPQAISVTISNNATTQIDSVMINYTINGVLQTPINYQNLIDTIGSLAGNTVQVPLTTYNFLAGTPATFVVWVSAPNGISPDGFSANDTLALTAGPSLSGNFTVNPNVAASATNFTSLASMSNALSSYGVCGPVNVTVSAGTYTDNIYLDNVVGSGSANPIVIDGVDSSTTIINYAGGGTGMGALSIGNTHNVTVKNFSFNNTSTSNAAGVILANSDYITVSNCYVSVDTTSTSSLVNGILISSSITTNLSGATNKYNTFQSNTIKGGYYGVRAYGSATQAVTALKFENNKLLQAYYYGFYAYYTDSLELIANTIDVMGRANVQADGAYIYYSTNPIINQNRIIAADYGIYYYMLNEPFTFTRRPMFSNNMIYSSTDFGLYMYYADSVDIFHNTIVTEGTVSPALQIYGNTTNGADGIDIRNNIFYSATTEAIETNSSVPLSSFKNFDYNNYYTGGTALLNIGGVSSATLAAFIASNPASNTNSIEGNPGFASLTGLDFHIISTLVDNQGDNTVGITVDIDGDVRPQLGFTAVDMGADEFGFGPVTNIAVDSLLTLESDCGLNSAEDIKVRLTNSGSTNYTLTPISYVINNGTPVTETITDTIFGGTSYVYTFNTKANFGTAGGYATTIYVTQVVADSIPANDTLFANIVRSPSTIMDTNATTDAFTDFELDNGDFSTYGTNSSWAWGTPSSFYINAAASGTKAWVSGLSAGYNANELSYLETQCYDFSGVAATEPVFIQFRNIFKTQTTLDKVWMESSLDNGKTWTKVMASTNALNWYNNNTLKVWTGFSSGGVGVWMPVVNDVLGIAGNSKVKFRFVLESDGSVQNEGFGIDDFRINLTVGEEENLSNIEAVLGVHPNPSNGQFNLVFNNYAKGIYIVEVMNVNGQLVNAENVAVASKFQTKPMNLDNLEKGVYFVKVTNGSSVTTQKLVIK